MKNFSIFLRNYLQIKCTAKNYYVMCAVTIIINMMKGNVFICNDTWIKLSKKSGNTFPNMMVDI